MLPPSIRPVQQISDRTKSSEMAAVCASSTQTLASRKVAARSAFAGVPGERLFPVHIVFVSNTQLMKWSEKRANSALRVPAKLFAMVLGEVFDRESPGASIPGPIGAPFRPGRWCSAYSWTFGRGRGEG